MRKKGRQGEREDGIEEVRERERVDRGRQVDRELQSSRRNTTRKN